MVNVDSGYLLKVYKIVLYVLVFKDLWLGYVYILVMNKDVWNSFVFEDKVVIGYVVVQFYVMLGVEMD